MLASEPKLDLTMVDGGGIFISVRFNDDGLKSRYPYDQSGTRQSAAGYEAALIRRGRPTISLGPKARLGRRVQVEAEAR